MEITSFVLGVLSVVFLLGITVGMFGARKIAKLEERADDTFFRLQEIDRRIDQVSELDNRRIDGEIDRTDRMITEIYRNMDERFDHLYRDLDSRLDKLENRLKENKQLLKS